MTIPFLGIGPRGGNDAVAREDGMKGGEEEMCLGECSQECMERRRSGYKRVRGTSRRCTGRRDEVFVYYQRRKKRLHEMCRKNSQMFNQ
jgi:hypothetical protein